MNEQPLQGSLFLHDLNKKMVITSWHDRSIVDDVGTLWFGVNDGYAPEGIDHVIFQVTGRGSIRINRPRDPIAGIGTYWIGFTGSLSQSMSKDPGNHPYLEPHLYGIKVPYLIEIREDEVIELRVVMVSKKGNVAISPESIIIGIIKTDDPDRPWKYKVEGGGSYVGTVTPPFLLD